MEKLVTLGLVCLLQCTAEVLASTEVDVFTSEIKAELKKVGEKAEPVFAPITTCRNLLFYIEMDKRTKKPVMKHVCSD